MVPQEEGETLGRIAKKRRLATSLEDVNALVNKPWTEQEPFEERILFLRHAKTFCAMRISKGPNYVKLLKEVKRALLFFERCLASQKQYDGVYVNRK